MESTNSGENRVYTSPIAGGNVSYVPTPPIACAQPQPPQAPVQAPPRASVPAPPYIPAQNRPPYGPVQHRCTTDRADAVMAVVLGVLAVLGVNFSIYGGFHIGYTIGYISLLLCGAVYLRRISLRPTVYGVLCLLFAVAGSGVFVWHNDSLIRFFCFCGIGILSLLAVLEQTGLAQRDKGTISSLLDVWRMGISRPFSHISSAIPALFLAKRGDNIEKRKCGGALLGILCALPVLVIVVPLLIASDAAFEGLLQHTILEHMGEMLISLLLGVGLFIWLFSLLYGLRHQLPEHPPYPACPREGVAATGINAFLTSISCVYLLYLFSQLAYFFSAFSGILPAEYTAAQYARRGFFEMCAVCTINLLLAACTLGLSRKKEGKAPLSTRILALFILLFSLVLVTISMSKMGLYIQSFGMTRLRILTAVFMLMLACVHLFVIIRLFAVKFPYMKAAVLAVAILGLITAYADVDTVISRYNVEAYQQGQLEELDVDTLRKLSDGAVTPSLITLWKETKDDSLRYQLTELLADRLAKWGSVETSGTHFRFTPDAAPDFRAYNLDVFRARRLLLDNAEEIAAAYELNQKYDSSTMAGR